MCKKEDVCDTCKHNKQKIEDNEMAEGTLICKAMKRIEALEEEIERMHQYLPEY